MNGGDRLAEVLERRGVRTLFTLCGGHIAPLLVGAKRLGIRVVDVRHEADAVFAADATARLTGAPGVAAVTAGPGVTNAITALKNAQMAPSPLVLIGGATATLLKGRGALQDIDQHALVRPHVKWLGSPRSVRELAPALERAFHEAAAGLPGPVFLEVPVDLLYDESLVRQWYLAGTGGGGLAGWGLRRYLERHLKKLFARDAGPPPAPLPPAPLQPPQRAVSGAARLLAGAERPVLVVGGQAVLRAAEVGEVAAAVAALGLPVYLAGGARGLLGAESPLQLRHRRKEALREADLVILAGMPADFRLDYGRHIARGARLVGANVSRGDLTRNRKPDVAAHADPGLFLRALAAAAGGRRASGKAAARGEWLARLRARDEEREREIAEQARQPAGGYLNPLALCRAIDRQLGPESLIVADGGDFVATAAYTLRPRAPLSWLDPGAFGTLGVGGGFALGAKLARPGAEVWLLWGDGSAAFSLAEFDALARHGVGVVAVVGNDAGWTQIAREQVPVLGDDVGTVLARTAYHTVAEGYGGRGFLLERAEEMDGVLTEARRLARSGVPVLINAQIGKTEFRKGSISI
ncbi:MAG TPA: thiamine pyrophosphate-binding protein [Thermoanaerobaculia bacterium]|nr:thiamine pyrophosphate-binding protein [Thermoanaerobaculia bacterium]